MPLMDAARSTLVLIDLQARLVPAVTGHEAVVAKAGRLVAAARLLDVPTLFTEQNPRGLGATVPELSPEVAAQVIPKMTFDAWRAPALREAVPAGLDVVLAGLEAHVCVLQTALGLLADGHRVFVVRDAVGSRREESREAGLARMAAEGVSVVTTEMAIFEWLGSAEHPRFKDAMALVR